MYSYQCPKRLWLKEKEEEYEIPVIVLFWDELLKLIPKEDKKVNDYLINQIDRKKSKTKMIAKQND